MAVGKISFRPALCGHRAFCRLRFEFEEFEHLAGSGRGEVTLSISPQPTLLTIISNPTASNSHKSCLVLKAFEFATPLKHLIALRSLKTPGRHRLYVILLSITCLLFHRAQCNTEHIVGA